MTPLELIIIIIKCPIIIVVDEAVAQALPAHKRKEEDRIMVKTISMVANSPIILRWVFNTGKVNMDISTWDITRTDKVNTEGNKSEDMANNNTEVTAKTNRWAATVSTNPKWAHMVNSTTNAINFSEVKST
jgi:hypothetical protein